jgi:hypothetical protein
MASKEKIKKRIVIPPCGLCGKIKKPRFKTECCGNWVCGDESDYVMFSYSRDICSRNHRRYTLCGYHHTEEHEGDWKTCKKCYDDFKHELEMYVWYGTNEYNFEKLPNPPKFPRTHCAGCDKIISLPDGGYTSLRDIYVCGECMEDGFDIDAAAGVARE